MWQLWRRGDGVALSRHLNSAAQLARRILRALARGGICMWPAWLALPRRHARRHHTA